MAINFNQESVFNLSPISINEVREDVHQLLVDGEEIIYAFKTVRDQLIFTDKRIISIDVQGITGTKISYATMPYAKIQYFTVQTPSVAEILFADSELYIVFNNGFTTKFEFKGDVDIRGIGKLISEFIL
ncbi:MAG: PH domain-containing protein [Erysipelotrichaceae bacterium]|mgnify:FL=1|nr:PH domain-containing protein [Erysipelotrichaceae bacterium]